MKVVAFTSKETHVLEINKPIPNADEIIVKVQYSALDTALDECKQKTYIGGMLHDIKVDPLVLGWHYCGNIENIGSNVKDFKVNDVVFGHLQYSSKTKEGSLSEYIKVKSDSCALKPVNIGCDVAAASATEMMTALQGLRDAGGIVENNGSSKIQSVLVNGAGGGVGSAAVQIAKHIFGAHVTAVCSTKDVSRVEKLGADIVIDRKKNSDLLSAFKRGQYDVIFDTPSVLPAAKSLKFLKAKGKMVLTAPNLSHLWGFFVSLFSGRSITFFIVQSKKNDLELIAEFLKKGELKVDIDSTYSIKNIDNALVRNRDKSKSGRVVVRVENSW